MDKPDVLPRYIQVESMLEFCRLVCALEHAPRVSFLHDHEGKKVLSVQMDFLKDRPVIYYTPAQGEGHYLSYGFRSGKEESDVAQSTTDKSKMYSPIVRIKSLPGNLQPGNGAGAKYHPIELEDMASLAKISYGLEEVPYPLFSFPSGDKWLIGIFMNFNEDGPSYFLHVSLDSRPASSFLKYAMNNGKVPVMVDTPTEHGYSYVKIIRLKDPHPLVDHAQLQN